MSLRFGIDCKLYVDDGDSYASPTWLELDNGRDVTLNLESTTADASCRRTFWELVSTTMLSGSTDFQLLYVPGDAAFDLLLNAFLTRDLVNVAVMDGGILVPGSQGFHALMHVTKFSVSQPLKENSMVDVTVAPGYHDVQDPEWMTIT